MIDADDQEGLHRESILIRMGQLQQQAIQHFNGLHNNSLSLIYATQHIWAFVVQAMTQGPRLLLSFGATIILVSFAVVKKKQAKMAFQWFTVTKVFFFPLAYFTCRLHFSYGSLPGCGLALCSYLRTHAEETASGQLFNFCNRGKSNKAGGNSCVT